MGKYIVIKDRKIRMVSSPSIKQARQEFGKDCVYQITKVDKKSLELLKSDKFITLQLFLERWRRMKERIALATTNARRTPFGFGTRSIVWSTRASDIEAVWRAAAPGQRISVFTGDIAIP